ncbi:uncharacterized protein LOC119090083 [Pollicipes pollicipes]|uniref:uncharacterized protein LOC119090083 n=1 Tax=Pollicipes pollicipes TaxID=41117 RepID=UPI001884A70C|nr:uncharacterized protein LOC119090083 [Pollicipes pollicipes]
MDSDNDMDNLGAGDAKADTISNIVEQLKSACTEERLSGCLTFSQLVSRELTLDVLRAHRLVRLVGPLLVDPNQDVREASDRAVSAANKSDVCRTLLRCLDLAVYPSEVVVAVGEYLILPRCLDLAMYLSEMVVAVGEYLILLRCLDLAVYPSERVVAVGEYRTLLRCLDRAVYHFEVVVAVGECLYALSEDNESVAVLVREQAPLVRALLTADGDSGDRALLRVLALGILINVSSDGNDLRPGQAMTLITRTLTYDARNLACKVSSNAEAEDYELQLADLSLLLNAQRVALEILTDLSSGDDASDGWADQDSLEHEDELDDEDQEDAAEMMEEDGWRDDGAASALPNELHEAIMGGGLLRTLLAKADCPPANVADILTQTPAGSQVCKRFRTLRCGVFLCLSNLVTALSLPELGGDAELVGLWRRMAQLVFGDEAGEERRLAADAVSCRMPLVYFMWCGSHGQNTAHAHIFLANENCRLQ